MTACQVHWSQCILLLLLGVLTAVLCARSRDAAISCNSKRPITPDWAAELIRSKCYYTMVIPIQPLQD
jgi:hypothetical protein